MKKRSIIVLRYALCWQQYCVCQWPPVVEHRHPQTKVQLQNLLRRYPARCP